MVRLFTAPNTIASQDITVYNYLRSLPEVALGNVYAADADDWDRYEKVFTFTAEYDFFK